MRDMEIAHPKWNNLTSTGLASHQQE